MEPSNLEPDNYSDQESLSLDFPDTPLSFVPQSSSEEEGEPEHVLTELKRPFFWLSENQHLRPIDLSPPVQSSATSIEGSLASSRATSANTFDDSLIEDLGPFFWLKRLLQYRLLVFGIASATALRTAACENKGR